LFVLFVWEKKEKLLTASWWMVGRCGVEFWPGEDDEEGEEGERESGRRKVGEEGVGGRVEIEDGGMRYRLRRLL
jgi:hypothetical protein